MAMYNRFSRTNRQELDLADRIDLALHWCMARWRTGLAALLVIAVGIGLGAWFQYRARQAAQAAALAYYQAAATTPHDRAQLEQLVATYPKTLVAHLARFELADLAMQAGQGEAVRTLMTPLTESRSAPAFLVATAMEWIAYSFEQSADWNNAATWFEKALKHPGNIDREAALRNTVRCLQQAGRADAAAQLLQTAAAGTTAEPTTLDRAKEIERLWLAIAPQLSH